MRFFSQGGARNEVRINALIDLAIQNGISRSQAEEFMGKIDSVVQAVDERNLDWRPVGKALIALATSTDFDFSRAMEVLKEEVIRGEFTTLLGEVLTAYKRMAHQTARPLGRAACLLHENSEALAKKELQG